MLLRSDSGFSMPFEESERQPLVILLPYGEQKHPVTGELFFHHGMDFQAPHYLLFALATGTVSAVGTDPERGLYQTIRYGKYEVTYRHLINVFANFGDRVVATMEVSQCDQTLHLEVRFDNEELNPLDFLVMLNGNVKVWCGAPHSFINENLYKAPVATPYDHRQDEVEKIMFKDLFALFTHIASGRYVVPDKQQQSLLSLLTVASQKKYFYNAMPTMDNPAGLDSSPRTLHLLARVQTLLVEIVLTFDEWLKKNVMRRAVTAPPDS